MTQLTHVGITAMCPHGGPVQVVPGNPRVRLSGQPAATTADQFLIAGCPFVIGSVPSPCMTIQWMVPAMRVRIGGQPAVLSTSTGLCLAATQAPQGPPQIAVTQLRVKAQ
jgi:uncharacterized Zn-binding protein involved in type VI secretion